MTEETIIKEMGVTLKEIAPILEDLEMVNALAIMVFVGMHQAYGRDTLVAQIKDLIETMELDMEVDEVIKLVDKVTALRGD